MKQTDAKKSIDFNRNELKLTGILDYKNAKKSWLASENHAATDWLDDRRIDLIFWNVSSNKLISTGSVSVPSVSGHHQTMILQNMTSALCTD